MKSTKFLQWATIPVLALAIGLPAAHAQQGHDDHKQSDQGSNFRFRDQDRGQLQSHYKTDVNRYKSHPQGRPQFSRGQQVPANYHFQPVPSSYYRGMPPPPSGYQYGYSSGYVVAYNPTTRVIGDVLDLVDAATH